MKIAVGNDHRGVSVKRTVLSHLVSKGIECRDFGSGTDEAVDYPEYGFRVAQGVSSGEFDFGILVCSNGLGMTMVANKVKGVRAALCQTRQEGMTSRRHNDANILVLREGMDEALIDDIVDGFITTEFERGGRHERRVRKIHDLTGV